MVSFKNNLLVLCATILTVVNVSAKNSPSFGETITNTNITAEEVESAQKAWGEALLKISKDFKKDGLKQATLTAEAVLNKAYGYGIGPVLFKPTLTTGDQVFRTTKEGALAYFVGGNKKFANDSGFALKGWEKYEFKNAAVFINGDLALTMEAPVSKGTFSTGLPVTHGQLIPV
jgi:hypothetical protein